MSLFFNPEGFLVLVAVAAFMAVLLLAVARFKKGSEAEPAIKTYLARVPQYAVGLVLLAALVVTIFYS